MGIKLLTANLEGPCKPQISDIANQSLEKAKKQPNAMTIP